jgi:BMFP domain-containing protein YqiC
MLDKDLLEDISARAAALFPAAESARKQLQGQLFTLLQGSLGHLNLVTREEFDAQVMVLEKASARISQLASVERLLKAPDNDVQSVVHGSLLSMNEAGS